MEFKDRLKAARKHAGLNQTELAARTGLTQASISDLERGKSRGTTFVARLAAVCGVSPLWLADGSGSMLTHSDRRIQPSVAMADIRLWDDDTPLDDDEVQVPFLREVELAAGPGRFAIEEHSQARLRFLKQDLRHNQVAIESARCVSVRGNSMLPVLRDGATVGVDTTRRALADVIDGDLYALSHNGQLRIKQLYRLPGGIRLRSFNRDEHPDEDYSVEQMREAMVEILGRVFWWGMFAR